MHNYDDKFRFNITLLTDFEEILLNKGVITQDQLRIALMQQQKNKNFLSEILIDLRFVEPNIMGELISEITGYPYIDLEDYTVDHDLIAKFGKEFCKKHGVLPFQLNNFLHVAMFDPENILAQDTVKNYAENILNQEVPCKFYNTYKQAIIRILQKSADPAVETFNASFENLFNNLFNEAFFRNASDVHFLPLEQMVVVKFRIHGELIIHQHLEWEIYEKICVRLKILSKLDIAERRKPQSGGCALNIQDCQIDCRTSFHPCSYGESLVMRLLPTNRQSFSLSELGFLDTQIKAMEILVQKSYGLFLVCGPTGSGKTTTLHALLKGIDNQKKNIMTLEQPIEYRVNGIRQTEIHESGIINFADGVRSMLRHDPDVILIGEIRDEDTAKMALRASMTGHLVLATVHASCPFVAPARLIDLGIPPNLLAGQILAVLRQELIRTESGRTAKGELVEFNDAMHLLVGDGANSAKLRITYNQS